LEAIHVPLPPASTPTPLPPRACTLMSRWQMPSRWKYAMARARSCSANRASSSVYFSLDTMRSNSSPPDRHSNTCARLHEWVSGREEQACTSEKRHDSGRRADPCVPNAACDSGRVRAMPPTRTRQGGGGRAKEKVVGGVPRQPAIAIARQITHQIRGLGRVNDLVKASDVPVVQSVHDVDLQAQRLQVVLV
jgi:hypothetical protein